MPRYIAAVLRRSSSSGSSRTRAPAGIAMPKDCGGRPSGIGTVHPSASAAAQITAAAAPARRVVPASAATPRPAAIARHSVVSMKNRAGTRSPE
jgi:hypothetical protein